MISLDDFSPFTLDDRKDLSDHYGRYPPEHSDYLLGTMLPWGHYMSYSRSWTNGSLVIMTEHEGRKLLRPPVGPPDRDLLDEVISLSKELRLDLSLSMVGARTARWIKEARPEHTLTPHREYFEYVYLSSTLSGLPGKKYLNVRNYLNRFRRDNDHSVERIDSGNIDEVKDFLLRWCVQKGCDDESFLLHEREANRSAMEQMEPLGLEGLLIRIKDTVQAFCIYEKMTEDTAVVHFEKADQNIIGLYQAMNNECAKALHQRYIYINRESDMGIEGLRNVKERYGPDHMLEVFHAHH